MSKPDGCTAELLPGMIEGHDYFVVRGEDMPDGMIAVVMKPAGKYTASDAIEAARRLYGRPS